MCAGEEKEVMRAIEEATVTLEAKETTHQNNAQVVWTYGPERPTARIATLKHRTFRGDYDKHFRDRLQLDHQTYALTIHQLRVSDSGIYMCQSIGAKVLSQLVHLVVYSEYSSAVELGMKIKKSVHYSLHFTRFIPQQILFR